MVAQTVLEQCRVVGDHVVIDFRSYDCSESMDNLKLGLVVSMNRAEKKLTLLGIREMLLLRDTIRI
jgi:hypothetical protein